MKLYTETDIAFPPCDTMKLSSVDVSRMHFETVFVYPNPFCLG